MAGRPISEEHREARKKEVDVAINIIKQRLQPVTRKAIAEEMGITIQNLYGTGFLSLYVNELEGQGVVVKERGNSAGLTAQEAKQLTKRIARLQDENNRIKQKLNAQAKILKEKDAKIAELVDQLKIERGNTFLKQKRDFAQRRI